MPIQAKKLSIHTGAEILKFDMAQPLDSASLRELESIFHERGMLVFHNQSMTEDQHVAFSRNFGDLEIHVLKQYLQPGHPEILLISNVVEDGKAVGVKDAGHYWHTDLSYLKIPSRCSILYAKEIPAPDGERTYGDTCFVNTAAAFEALDEQMQEKLLTLHAVHDYQGRYSKLQQANPGRADLTEEQKKQVPPVVHPVVRTHPFTGRKCIYVNEGFTTSIVGMPQQESDELLQFLYAHCTQEKFMYRHKWQVGDVLMWDNCTTQHLAIADYELPQRRLLHRTTLTGSAVF